MFMTLEFFVSIIKILKRNSECKISIRKIYIFNLKIGISKNFKSCNKSQQKRLHNMLYR